MVRLTLRKEGSTEISRLGVATNAEEGLETKEERRSHFKKEFGVNTYSESKHSEN